MREKFKALKEKFASQSGFTLIELMATIAILALIVVIAVPAIGSIMSNAQDESYDNSQRMVERAAQIAHLDKDVVQATEGEFTVQELVDGGFLDLEIPTSYGDHVIDGNDKAVSANNDGNYVFQEVPAE